MTWNSYSCCCDWGYEAFYPRATEDDTPWCGGEADKLYLQSGQFSSTLKTSESIGAIDNVPAGISWDGTNTPWSGSQTVTANKFYLQSGQFTSTLKTSQDVGIFDGIGFLGAQGISWDGANTPGASSTLNSPGGAGGFESKLYLMSGQFSGTLKTSLDTTAIDITAHGISWDGTDTPWCGSDADKLYLQSGQFSSTMKTSESVGSIDAAVFGISWDGNNTPWCGGEADKLYLQSGQFSSTLKTSESVGGVDNQIADINTNRLTVG